MLSIITISFRDIEGLTKTIESVKNQNVIAMTGKLFEHIIVASGISKFDCEKLTSMYSSSGVHFMFNKDTGLYNAMNIGTALASGTHVLYLNGGDEFFDETSLGIIINNTSEGQLSLFRVVQYYDELSFIRPGLKSYNESGQYSHQGFVAPLTKVTPEYDEAITINADTFWMRECMALYPKKECADIIAKFALGGVSNRPRLKTIWLRLVTNGLTSAIKELIKLLLCNAMGEKEYYNMMSLRAGYDRVGR